MTTSLKAPPLCLSLVMADSLHRDPSTGKYTLLGTFNGLVSPRYPNSLPTLAVYYIPFVGRRA